MVYRSRGERMINHLLPSFGKKIYVILVLSGACPTCTTFILQAKVVKHDKYPGGY